MKTFQIISIIDGQPTFNDPLREILAHCRHGGAIKIMDPVEYITDRQRAWYNGPCLTGLSQWSGDSREHWDRILKRECGAGLLKRETFLDETGKAVTRWTIKGVGKNNMTLFIEKILKYGLENDLPIVPPDPELRRRK
jgi:hypothetical protein